MSYDFREGTNGNEPLHIAHLRSIYTSVLGVSTKNCALLIGYRTSNFVMISKYKKKSILENYITPWKFKIKIKKQNVFKSIGFKLDLSLLL